MLQRIAMRQTPHLKTERYIFCPICGKEGKRVDHLPIGCKTVWYCDECGGEFRLQVIEGGDVECEATGHRKDRTLVTLRSDAPVTLVVEGMVFSQTPEDEREHHVEYFYNEHTCPTNYMGNVLRVISGDGDTDPHGIFRFVKVEPWRDLEAKETSSRERHPS